MVEKCARCGTVQGEEEPQRAWLILIRDDGEYGGSLCSICLTNDERDDLPPEFSKPLAE